MKSPRDPRGPQPKDSNQPLSVQHQLGLVKTAGMVPQPSQPHLPAPPMPARTSNLAALQGEMKKG